MIVLYTLTRVLTLFGTILRTFWEHLICRICKISQDDVKPFKVSELCGHVEHELITKTSHSFLICFFPFAMNFLLSCCFLAPSTYKLFYIGAQMDFQTALFLWLGISLAANCVPSFEDVLMLKDCLHNEESKGVKIVLYPFFAIFCAFACLEKYSLTLIISVIWAFVFPMVTSF